MYHIFLWKQFVCGSLPIWEILPNNLIFVVLSLPELIETLDYVKYPENPWTKFMSRINIFLISSFVSVNNKNITAIPLVPLMDHKQTKLEKTILILR